MVARSEAVARGKAALERKIHLEGPTIVTLGTAPLFVLIVALVAGFDKSVETVLTFSQWAQEQLIKHWLLTGYLILRALELLSRRIGGRVGFALFLTVLTVPTWVIEQQM